MAPTSSQARMGAHKSWANTSDRSRRTAPARAASQARFERQVDPDGILPEAERIIRADHARRAFYTEMSIKAAAVRKAKAAARKGLTTAASRGGDSPDAGGARRGDFEEGSAA